LNALILAFPNDSGVSLAGTVGGGLPGLKQFSDLPTIDAVNGKNSRGGKNNE